MVDQLNVQAYKMPIVFLIYYIILTYVPEYFDSHSLYWVLNSVLFFAMAIYVFKKSKKTTLNLFSSVSLISIFSYTLINSLRIYFIKTESLDMLNTIVIFVCVLFSYFFVFRNRYKWEKQKSHTYNRLKIQAIYSKPKNFITLFGAAISLSPRCSVRYSYNGYTLRFKKGYEYPILCETVIKPTDIIKNTKYEPSYFNYRYQQIKNKKYSLLFFNCKSLMNAS